VGRASGCVLDANREVLAHFVYDGTSDTVFDGSLHQDIEQAWKVYAATRYAPMFRYCECKTPPQPATLQSHYGGGFEWPGTVCLSCMAIVDGRNATDYW